MLSNTQFNIICPSTMSLVVPSISVTIAFCSSSKLFNKLLLPTFGLPIIPTFIPSFIILPFSDSLIVFINLSFILLMLGNVFSVERTSISWYSG